MKDNKKKMAALIISKAAGPANAKEQLDEPVVKEGAEQDDSIGMESAAEDLMQAIEQKNAKGIVAAIKDLYAMCESNEPEEDNEQI